MTDILETLREARLQIESSICYHEETHRGGVLWTICDHCDAMWADDRGGFKKPKMPKTWLKLTQAISQLEKGKEDERQPIPR
jgi:hypothetical protein